MNPIAVVLFDFGGVINPDLDLIKLRPLEVDLGLGDGELQPLLYGGKPWEDLSTGRISETAYWETLSSQIGVTPVKLQQTVHSLWTPASADAGVIAVIKAIRPGIRVALLSNATLKLEEYLEALGISDLFDTVINSSRIGLRKPDPAVFVHALRILDVSPERVLFIDDKPRNTVVAAEMGLRVVDFRNAQELEGALKEHGLLTVGCN